MKVFGQVENAQLENKASDYTSGPVGRIWWNTVSGRIKVDDGTNIRALLRNDGNALIGNSGTGAQNIRFHRGAAGVLQFVTGTDVTAEGTLSTSLNQISARLENYTTAGLPSFGNVGRVVYDTTLTSLQYDTGAAWAVIGSSSRVPALYTTVVGSAAQVTSTAATHSTIASALAAMADDDNMLILKGTTFTENVSITKRVNIMGQGYGSYINGTVTFASGSTDALMQNVRISGNITINSGVSIVQLLDFWLGTSSSITDNGTGSLIQGVQE